MATGDTDVRTFFNTLAESVEDSMKTGNDAQTRKALMSFIDHARPSLRSGGRRSNWPVTARLLLNDLYLDGRQFPVGLTVLEKVIAHKGGLMGIEHMGVEWGNQGIANPKFRFLTLTVPTTGKVQVGGADVITYFAKDVPKSRNNVASVDKLDAMVMAAVATGGSEHIRVVAEALKPGYQDIRDTARLKKLLNGP